MRVPTSPSPTPFSHAILVLGAPARDNGTPGPGMQRRLERTLHEAQEDPDAVIVVSGGAVKTSTPEADVMKTWLLERGIPAHRIIAERSARYTLENIQLSVPFLQAAKVQKISLVTEQYHLGRALVLLNNELRSADMRCHVRIAAAQDRLSPEERTRIREREWAALVRDDRCQQQGLCPVDEN